MNEALAKQLIELDNEFYRVHAESFSATRRAPWAGWKQAWEIATRELGLGDAAKYQAQAPLRVLDLACGNLRFERAVKEAAPQVCFAFDALDCCDELAEGQIPAGCTFRSVDILDELAEYGVLPASVAGAPHDLSACFGFMHHVPGFELRCRVLQALAAATKPGGIIVVSFWQFMNDERLAAKAKRLTQAVRSGELCPQLETEALDEGDFFLDWQSDGSVLRYCHHTEDKEISQLIEAANASGANLHELDRYAADGRSGALNRYVILKRD